jgi:hypothetical protein
MTSDEHVEERLRDLALHLPPRPTADLLTAVLERVAQPDGATPSDEHWARLRRPVLAAAALCLALVAAYALLAPVRDATASVLRLVGIDIHHADSGARPPTLSPPVRAELGKRVTVADVSAEAGFAVPMPHTPALGDPDEAYVVDRGAYQVVTLVWREREGIPIAPASGASALLSVFRGAPPVDDWVRKILYEGAQASQVSVNGGVGVFVSGPQSVRYVGGNGDLHEALPRLSANSLIWQQDGVTLRLEAAVGADEALALAESVRP